MRRHLARVLRALGVGVVVGALGVGGWALLRNGETETERQLPAAPSASRGERAGPGLLDAVAEIERRAAGFRIALSVLVGAVLLAWSYVLRRDRRARLRAAHASMSALSASNRLVLENVSEGLLTFSLDGKLGPEVSAAALGWFGAPDEDETVQSWLGRADPTFGAYLDLGMEELREDLFPREVILAHLPASLRARGRSFAVRYTSVEGEDPQVLLTLTDVTEKLAREEEEQRQIEVIGLVQRLGRDPRGTLEFLQEMEQLLGRLARCDDPAPSRRLVHTMKGNAGIYGLQRYAEVCHAIEQEMENQARHLTPGEWSVLSEDWTRIRTRVAPFLPTAGRGIQLAPADVAGLRAAVSAGAPAETLLRIIDGWSKEGLEARFERLRTYLWGLAGRLGRCVPDVEISAPPVQLEPERWKAFWGASVHLIRNILDHGIETPEDRRAAGKPEKGVVELIGQVSGAQLLVSFADDGRGIDWDRIRAKAEARGLPTATERDLVEALFADGISSRDRVTETSGRGVGMSAVRAEAEALGGCIDICSKPGEGTRVSFCFPLSDAVGVDSSGEARQAS